MRGRHEEKPRFRRQRRGDAEYLALPAGEAGSLSAALFTQHRKQAIEFFGPRVGIGMAERLGADPQILDV